MLTMLKMLRNRFSWGGALLFIIALGVGGWFGLHAAPSSSKQQIELNGSVYRIDGKLEIKTHKGSVFFQYEEVKSPEQQQRGLMYRKALPENYAMLFSYEKAAPRSMWMKNTYIPLDMLFVDENQVIFSIHHRAEPLSEEIIHSQGNAIAVVEIEGGFAQKFDIQRGDKIIWQK